MGKRFLIVTKGPDGAMQLHNMREWLRQNPQHIPQGMTTDQQTNSWSLRRGLRREGWGHDETDSEVRLLHPDLAADPKTISVLGEQSEAADDETTAAREEFAFDFEASLRDFIARNLTAIPVRDRRLRLFADGAGQKGVEYQTGVGRIDVLAVDEAGNLYVFELKLDRSADDTMGQLTRYMGWVAKRLANGREVHGIIVAKVIDEKLRYAALVVPNVSLLEYQVEFKLNPARPVE